MQSVEKRIQFSVKSDGVITVFLSLVLLLILALVSVTLESARLAGARFLTESYTRMAQNSVMAEYSGALFDRYHIFAHNSRAGTGDGVRHALETKTAYYINKNLSMENRVMWTPVLQTVKTEEYTLLTDNAGEAFRTGAIEYMKYRGTSLLVETLLSSLGVFQGAQETSRLLETKTATEEALAEIDTCVLELFESVDGFVRDDTGIKQNFWGKVKINKNFVKKLLAEVPTAESAQINHPELLEAVQTSYVNPNEVFADMAEQLGEYERIQEELGWIAQRLAEISKEITEETGEEEFMEEDNREGKTAEGESKEESILRKSELVMEQAVLEAESLFYQGELLVVKQRYRNLLRSWKSTVEGCEKAVDKALAAIELIRTRQTLTQSKVLQYEEQLMGAVKWLDASLYEELSAGLDMMKHYVGLESEGIERLHDIDRMEKTLEQNRTVLTRMLELIGTESEESGVVVWNEEARISQMTSLATGYSHEGLYIDYSGIRLKAEGKSPVEGFSELLGGGIAALVINDTSTVSQAVLGGTELPSRQPDMNDNDTENRGMNGEEAHSSKSFGWTEEIGTGVSGTLTELNRNSPLAGINEWVTKEGGALTEQALFLSYLGEHFSNYADAEETGEQESVLAYELEYILCGNAKDATNLYEIVGKLLAVRFIFNLIHVLSDAEKCTVAEQTALGLLGVTGLPVLVSIMKYLLLFVWAAEAALVETAAILQGKKLSLVPQKSEFPVSFSELLLMTKARIQEKAANLSEKKGAVFGYQEYIMLFLLLQNEETKCMRALDIVQENLALEEPGFRAMQQVSSFRVQAEYLLPELFTALPFSKRKTGGYVL